MHFLKRSQRPTTQTPSHNAPAPGSAPTSDDYLLYIHTVCPTKNAPAGEIIVENQKSLDTLYVIINGALEVTIATKYAPYTLELSKGNFFGFIPAQADDPAPLHNRYIFDRFIELSKRIFDNFPDGIKQDI
jgi:CRP-like cAMP-binding protein